MRQLVAEAQAARAAKAAPVVVEVDPASAAGDWSYVWEPKPEFAVCHHGRTYEENCATCGRFITPCP